MNSLPLYVLDEILFRLDPKSLAKMRCMNTSINSHISDDRSFQVEYISRLGSSLFHISKYGSPFLCFHPNGNPHSFQNKQPLESSCNIIGSCSGLLLLSFDGLCVVNPFTNKFRFLDCYPKLGETKSMGFAVSQMDRNTKRFHIVCIIVLQDPSNPDETRYEFEINTGDSWEVSKTTITCLSSNLKKGKNSKPVYLNGSLHWLRKDGSIIAFNPVTEEARLIPTKFKQEQSAKHLLCAAGNRLELISATEKVIYFFSLNLKTDSEWILVKQIKNKVVVDQSMPLLYWDVVAYDGKCLVVRTMKNRLVDSVLQGYDLGVKEWGVVGSIPGWCDSNRNFFLYKLSWSSVIGLLDQEEWIRKSSVPKSHRSTSNNPARISFVKAIMDLVKSQ